MTDRERKLAIGMAAVVGLWGISSILPENALSPFKNQNEQISSLKDSIKQLSEDETAQMLRAGELKQWQGRSLPPDPLVAQRLYQIWLVDLAEFAGFQSVVPTLGSRPIVGQRGGSRGQQKQEPLGSGVNVSLKARATLEQVATFLYHFERTALMHRITQCDVLSTEIDGNPQLQVTIAAEGLALTSAPPRNRLFPQSLLETTLSAKGTQLSLTDGTEFPTQGEYRIRIGREFLQVTRNIEPGKWEVTRGIDGTKPMNHEAGEIAELTPLALPRTPEAPRSIADYKSLLAAGPFTRPAPPVQYRPSLKSISDQTILQGNSFTAKASVSGWDPSWQPPIIKLGEGAPSAMTLTPQGEISWKTAANEPVGSKSVSVLVFRESREEPVLTTKFRITLKARNSPPKISPAKAPLAWLGRPFEMTVSASDPDPQSRLTFSLTGAIPEGAAIAPLAGKTNSARITWTPLDTLEPGDFTLTVQVQDNGDPPLKQTLDIVVTADDDYALETYFVGSFRDGDYLTAMMTSRLENRTFYPKVGDVVEVADVRGTVRTIGDRHLILQSGEKLYRLQLGQNLRQLAEVSPQESSSSLPPASTAPPRNLPVSGTPSTSPPTTPPAKTEETRPPSPAPAEGDSPTTSDPTSDSTGDREPD